MAHEIFLGPAIEAVLAQFGLDSADPGFAEALRLAAQYPAAKGNPERVDAVKLQDKLSDIVQTGAEFFGQDWRLTRDIAVIELCHEALSARPHCDAQALGARPLELAEILSEAFGCGIEHLNGFLDVIEDDREALFFLMLRSIGLIRVFEAQLDSGRPIGNPGYIVLAQDLILRATLVAERAEECALKDYITEAVPQIDRRLEQHMNKLQHAPRP